MSKITIWGRKSSVNVQLVLWAMDELGLDFDRIDAGFIYGVVDSADFCRMNPNRLVPVLVDGDGAPIFESAAICGTLLTAMGMIIFGRKMRLRELRLINGPNGRNGMLVMHLS